ncbi:MAG: DUF63 family protein [Candidatus Hydrothermarchaeales archaeon]
MAVYTIQDYVIAIAILLVILWLCSKYLLALVAFDEKFLLTLMPYIIFGIALRMMVDIGIFKASKYWNVTPGVHVVTVVFASIALGIGLLINRYTGREYWHFPFVMGSIGAGFFLVRLLQHMTHPGRMIYAIALATSTTLVIYVISGFFDVSKIFREKENAAIIFAHLLDGSATFVGINVFHFTEEHLLPGYLISLAGGNAIVMIPLKIMVILLALYVIERWYLEEILITDDPQKTEGYYDIFKFVFFILGIGPGLRDTILPALI